MFYDILMKLLKPMTVNNKLLKLSMCQC